MPCGSTSLPLLAGIPECHSGEKEKNWRCDMLFQSLHTMSLLTQKHNFKIWTQFAEVWLKNNFILVILYFSSLTLSMILREKVSVPIKSDWTKFSCKCLEVSIISMAASVKSNSWSQDYFICCIKLFCQTAWEGKFLPILQRRFMDGGSGLEVN